MKPFISLSLAASTLVAIATFSSCTKTSDVRTPDLTTEERTTNGMTISQFQTEDRVDAIVKDLAIGNYSFSFGESNPSFGVTRTAYGTDNYLTFADPQDLICPDPIRKRYPHVPIWKRPQFIVPTCPDMAIDIHKLDQIRDIFKQIDPRQFGDMRTFKAENGATFLATQQMLKTYANLELDKMDGLLGDLNAAKFIMMSGPDIREGGVFQRNFYGYANLNDIVFKPYRRNLKDLIKPTIKGCFDPLILKTIKERLVRVNPALYNGLEVVSLPENRAIAVLN